MTSQAAWLWRQGRTPGKGASFPNCSCACANMHVLRIDRRESGEQGWCSFSCVRFVRICQDLLGAELLRLFRRQSKVSTSHGGRQGLFPKPAFKPWLLCLLRTLLCLAEKTCSRRKSRAVAQHNPARPNCTHDQLLREVGLTSLQVTADPATQASRYQACLCFC